MLHETLAIAALIFKALPWVGAFVIFCKSSTAIDESAV